MFAERRERFRAEMGPDAVAILVGARLATRSNDTEYPFRQDSDFWYLTGFDQPDAVAILRTDGGPAFTLFVQPREPAAETWTGIRPGVEGAMNDFGADTAKPIGELSESIPDLIAKADRLYHILGRDSALDARIVEVLEEQRRRSRTGINPASEIVDPRSLLHEYRLFKSDEELALMRRAAEITCEAHRAAAGLSHSGHHEYELEAVLDYTYRRRGGAGPAYGTIVGGGGNATILHYVSNDQPLKDGDLVLIDSGCEYQGYAADVTRTYPVGGSFRGAGRAVYETVLAAQDAALDACKPGATLESIHEIAVRSLVEGMLHLKLLSGTVDECIEKQSYTPYYMHRTSHWLGLDVHDVGVYSQKGAPRPLEPGIVFTVEPGLYIPVDDEKAPVSLRGIGVRIEDDVLVTDTGHENLSAAIPKRTDEVEAWVENR